MGSIAMDIELEYGAMDDIDAYLSATPPGTARKHAPTATAASRSGNNANHSDGAHDGHVERRQPRRPLSVIGDDAVLDATAVNTQARHDAGFEAGNNGYGNLSDRGRLSTTSSNARRCTSTQSGGRTEDFRLPAISPATETHSTAGRNLRPSLSSNGATSHQSPATTHAVSNDRARSYEPGKNGPASTPSSTGNGTSRMNGVIGYEPTRDRKLATAPNGRVSPLKNAPALTGLYSGGTGAANHYSSEPAPAAAETAGKGNRKASVGIVETTIPGRSNGWVREQARRLDMEVARNTPGGTPLMFLGSHNTSAYATNNSTAYNGSNNIGTNVNSRALATGTTTAASTTAGAGAGGHLSSGVSATTGKDSPVYTKPKAASGWDAGGYDLGYVLDSSDDIPDSNMRGRGGNAFPSVPPSPLGRPPCNATAAVNSARNSHHNSGTATSGDGATANVATRSSTAATASTRPANQFTATNTAKTSAGAAASQPPRSTGGVATTSTVAGAPLTRGTTTSTTTTNNNSNNSANSATNAATLNRTSNKLHVNGNGAAAGEFRQMPRAENIGSKHNSNLSGSAINDTHSTKLGESTTHTAAGAARIPPWRAAQQSLTSTVISKAAAAATTTTTAVRPPVAPSSTTPTGAARPSLVTTLPKNAITVQSVTSDSRPSSRNAHVGATSNPVTPSFTKRIRMEATDTSALPSVAGSFTSNQARQSHGMNMNQSSSKAAVHTASAPAALANSACQHVKLPYSAADRAALEAWQNNAQILSAAPTPMYNATHLPTKANGGDARGASAAGGVDQWYPRDVRVAAEMAGEAVELDEKLHNVFTLLRHRQRPLNLAYPPVLPVELEQQNAKRRPRTPRSYYGPKMKHVSKDWYKDALTDAKTVDSPDLATLDKIDGNKKQRGGARR